MKKQLTGWIILLLLMTACTSSPTFTSVQEVKKAEEGTEQTIQGYIVGVPTQVEHVETKDFSSDYALALADQKGTTNLDEMVFVQLKSEYRQEFGLMSNPDLMGATIAVSGVKEPYFSHDGMKQVSKVSLQSTQTQTEEEGGEDYYQVTEGLTGEALKNKLNDLIDAHTELSYDDVWNALRELDENPEKKGDVLLLYSGKSLSKDANGGDVDEWNREHVWPKSHGDFGTAMGPGTDLHHLKPTDMTINSSRNNLDFDNGGEPQGEAAGTFSDQDSWEPRDEVKGDVARMVFYMAVRYEGERDGEPDLELVDRVETDGPALGKQSTLLQWHKQDPVSEPEIRRNDLIFTKYQGNRNPFIDHPEFVEKIW
ncbi:endonuclease [Halobacillus litoralis]|uniref:endonuclease n=1 Tax=Halobacillus litoralis TaxID=45668 RepID=UPI001CD362B4|nr:endonuclease [Halobacillus litoralis]MCA0971982.1 endonuclease [Halobacillus litoralis]